jgi:NAD(P)H-flavin reductase
LCSALTGQPMCPPAAESSAYLDKIPEWAAAGVKVSQVFSADGGGYVQDVFAKELQVSDPKQVAVVLCGQKGMCEAVKALVAEAGVDSANVLLNF